MADAAPHADPGYWVNDLSPFIIRFSDHFGLRWYGMAYVAGLVLGGWLLARWARQGRAPLRVVEVQDFALFAGLGMVLGGRLGYCLFYAGNQMLRDPFYIFKVYEGGMASHGGIVGLFLGIWLFARRRKRDLLVLCDLVGAAGPIGIGLGRIANFINGELWGRPTTVAWAVIFPKEVDPPGNLDPESAAAWAYQLAHAFPPYALPRHPSQLYAAMLEAVIPLAIVLPLHARHRRPGLTTGTFFVLYAIGRFVDEFFREPDRGQPGFDAAHPAILGFMSKGQALTLPLFAIGIALIIWALRRPPRPEAYLPPADSVSAK